MVHQTSLLRCAIRSGLIPAGTLAPSTTSSPLGVRHITAPRAARWLLAASLASVSSRTLAFQAAIPPD